LNEKKRLTLGSLFDGIGGFPYAASFYGIRPVWASEIVPECIAVTKRHFPDMDHLGDVTQLHGDALPPVDILTFGSPCQGLSAAGRRLGLADERSGLFMEAIRIIHEMQEATNGKYPQFAIFENVPGALFSSGRRDFKAVLEAFTGAEIPMPESGRWANAGMVRGRGVDLAWVIYDAQHFGTAQRRRRLFLVADFGGQRAGQILFIPKSLRGYFEAGGTPRQGITAFAEDGAGTAGTGIEILNDQGGDSITVERGGLSPTLRSQTHGNLPIVACMASGQANAEVCADKAPTLVAAHEHPIVVYPKLAGTLCASGAGLSRPAGMGSELDFCVFSAGFKHKASAKAGNIGYQEEIAPTLISGQESAVIKTFLSEEAQEECSELPAEVAAVDCRNHREISEVSGTLQSKAKSGGYSLNYQNPIRIGYHLRRLTPTEAERLMGLPDDWTKYGCDGRQISDSKRYQMLGNGVVTTCVAYIMQGITDVLKRGDVL